MISNYEPKKFYEIDRLDENGEEDDEEGGGEEDVLEGSALVQDGDQGEADGPAQAAISKNKLLLC